MPQSLALDERRALLVISGPNMGGKTVALKMVGLFVAMTYCGMQRSGGVGTRIGRFERVIADIGDEQSIAANTSTFSAHWRACARCSTAPTRGRWRSSTRSAAAPSRAPARRWRSRCWSGCSQRGARGDRHDARDRAETLRARGTPGVANASVRFDPETFEPTFHLDVGAPGQSLAFPLARSLGIADAIVDARSALLDNRERDYESALAELSLRNAELQRERERLEAANARRRERERGSAAARARALDAERRRFGDQAEERMQQALRDFVARAGAPRAERIASAARPKVTPSQAALLGRRSRRSTATSASSPGASEPADEAAFQPDDRVRVLSLRRTATWSKITATRCWLRSAR